MKIIIKNGANMKNFSNCKWGLVLAGGGGKGAYQIGVFRALREKLIDNYITAVSGSSVGALNAVLYALSSQKIAEYVWGEVTPDKFLKVDPSMIDLKEGLVSREGLMDIIDQYVNLEQVSNSDLDIYITTTIYDSLGLGKGVAKYHRLNYKEPDTIKKLLLASSAMPVIYSPIEIDGFLHRDGGVADNLPIEPLYDEGIRNFIVVGLSENTQLDYDKYSDAEFVFIKPGESIGDFFSGTLDFSKNGVKLRMELGYLDAIRILEFSDKDINDSDIGKNYRMAEQNDYRQLRFILKKYEMESHINENLEKINNILYRYK